MINKYIDYIDDPKDTFEEYLDKAKKYDFRCIFADLDQHDFAVDYLKDTTIIVAGAIDFPEGVLSLNEKMERFKKYAAKGYKEIDYVLNQENIESKNFIEIKKEMKTVSDFCRQNGIVDKTIVEMCKLDDDQSAKEKICQIANEVKPAFLKTSTGRSFSGAKIADVELMKKTLDEDVHIKAAGGIHNYAEARSFIAAGASVLGASAGIAIVEGE